MMVLDDEIRADWASNIFSSLLENVNRCHTFRKTQQMTDVYYVLLISFLLEKRMPSVDRGELLADSDFQPYRNIKRRKYQPTLSVKIPLRLGTDPDDELGIKLGVTASPTFSEIIIEQEILAKQQNDNLFKEMEEIETEERTRTSSVHKRKKLLRTKSVAPSRTTTQRQGDEPKSGVSQSRLIKRRRTLRNRRPIIQPTLGSEDNSAQSKDPLYPETDNSTEGVIESTPVPQPDHHHKWDTRDELFSEIPSYTVDIIIPSK